MQRSFGKRFLIYFMALFAPGLLLGLLMALTTNSDGAIPGLIIPLVGILSFCSIPMGYCSPPTRCFSPSFPSK
ncbi:hypothetical protein MKQ70_34070 [Chitinophaga sedimenti]|uniref:hypothetical protein n=1 Tax=Chitinophaga sedimenti TaxID=2033606 RepID=UPI002004496F|nr:hypothetical protein [Chitinophaga sedimenti]MCK7559703.1 hypothetical protein [Chitinophaga sedimenti]